MKPTREQALDQAEQWEGDLGLNNLPIEYLGGLCQSLGVSARGSKDELVKRIRRELHKPR